MKFNRFIARYQWMKTRKKEVRTDKKGNKFTVFVPSWSDFKKDYLTENPMQNKEKGEQK